MRSRYQHYWSLQGAEAPTDDEGSNVCGNAATWRRFVHQDESAGVLHALENRLFVERRRRARVDEVALHALLRQSVQRLLRKWDHTPQRDDCRVIAFAEQIRFSEGDCVRLLRHLALARIECLVLEEHYRIVVSNGLNHEALSVVRVRRDHDLQPGYSGQQPVNRLRVLRSHVHASTHGGADHYRARALATEHVAELRDLVVDLIHADTDEVGEHDFGNRPQTGERGSGGRADDCRLADRRVDDPVRAELRQQAPGDAKDASRRLPLARCSPGSTGDILAAYDDTRIARPFLAQRLIVWVAPWE